jgi:hypothetical protein
MRLFETDVSGLPIGSIWTSWPLIRPIGSPETSVSNHLTPRSNPEDRRIHGLPVCSCSHYTELYRHVYKMPQINFFMQSWTSQTTRHYISIWMSIIVNYCPWCWSIITQMSTYTSSNLCMLSGSANFPSDCSRVTNRTLPTRLHAQMHKSQGSSLRNTWSSSKRFQTRFLQAGSH